MAAVWVSLEVFHDGQILALPGFKGLRVRVIEFRILLFRVWLKVSSYSETLADPAASQFCVGQL